MTLETNVLLLALGVLTGSGYSLLYLSKMERDGLQHVCAYAIYEHDLDNESIDDLTMSRIDHKAFINNVVRNGEAIPTADNEKHPFNI